MSFLTQEELSRADIRRNFLIKQLTRAKYSFLWFGGEFEYLAMDDHLATHLAFEAAHGRLIKIISGPMMHGMKNIFLELHQRGKIRLFARPIRDDHQYFLIVDSKRGWFMEEPRGLLRSFQEKNDLRKMTSAQVKKSLAFFTETLNSSQQANAKVPLLMPDGYMQIIGQWLTKHRLDYNKLTAAEIVDIFVKLQKEKRLTADP